jgi:hypothetical protein
MIMANFNEQYEQLDSLTRERIELSGPDSEGLSSELTDRVRAFDGEVTAAMSNVELPEGLNARILDRIRSESAPRPASPVAPKTHRSHTRRWALATSATVLALIALGWVAGLFGPEELAQPLNLADVPEAAVQQFDIESGLAYTGRLVMDPYPTTAGSENGPTPETHPISRRVFASPNTTWRPIDSFLGREAIAYDLTDSSSSFRATLYVFDAEGAEGPVPSEDPPLVPNLDTRNRVCGVWLAENHLYVLVVEGDLRRYHGMLDIPDGPIT